MPLWGGLRIGVENSEPYLSDFARVLRRSARVIDDPIALSVGINSRRTEKDHHVKRKLLDPRLIKEKQIAGLGCAPVTADKLNVEILQRPRVSKFRKLARALVFIAVRTNVGAKDLFAKLIRIKIKTAHVAGDRFIGRPHALEPRPVMFA